MIRAHGRRVADADPEDLADLVALRDVLEETIAAAVEGLRAGGSEGHYRPMPWSQIARGLGTTRQAAQMRYGQPVDSRVRLPA